MHLQHSPRKKNFGYEETIRLLELWTHYTNGGTHPELGKGHRTGRLWLVISERMKAMNYNRGPEECKVRVGNLRAKYTKLKRGYLAGSHLLSTSSPVNAFCFPPRSSSASFVFTPRSCSCHRLRSSGLPPLPPFSLQVHFPQEPGPVDPHSRSPC